jgi:outer membrane receptor protein involved in Fe transport
MMFRRVAAATLAVTAVVQALPAAVTRADDLADEADLHFRLGTEAYASRDFRRALEHFLLSNRLVPNRNVVFNIARTYEQLTQYADAHRYYSIALDVEQDATRRAAITEAITRIRPYVAVLRVVTEPPGATIFINRRDLGPRGQTPRALAFAPGRYRVLAELDGYEPGESPEVVGTLGQETLVTLRLTRIVGTLRVEGDDGAIVHLDRSDSEPVGRVPCDVVLPPGRHRIFVSREGYATTEQEVEVRARETVTARPRLTPLTGTLVVNADERDALVEVDGRPSGFTPVVVSVPVGQRRVRISLAGFRTIDQTVEVRHNEQTRLAPELRQIEEVEAASRTAEAVEDAPSSVSVIPRQEIQAMGYPTIAEAMRGVRGVFVSDDRFYPTVGFRGFSQLGNYGNRVLVLINGQPTNDNWGFFSFTGYDARVDLEDVERIEVVRGPGSVLYGTGAVSGAINVVTRGRDARQGVNAQVSVVENNIARARVGGTVRFGNDAGLWTSVGVASSAGRDFQFPEAATAPMMGMPGFDGASRGADGFDALTVQGRSWYRSLSAQWLVNTRTKRIPTGVAGTAFGDDRTYNSDTRGTFELRFEPRLTDTVQLFSRAAFNHYNFIGSYSYGETARVSSFSRERFLGSWALAEARAVWTPSSRLRVTVGLEGQYHFQAQQRGESWGVGEGCAMAMDACNRQAYLGTLDAYDEHPFQILAGYALADLSPARALRLSLGVRYDQYFFGEQTFGAFSPRVAAILRPYTDGNVKVLFGRAFRAPGVYEQFYNDGGANSIPSPGLTPETMWSGEVEYSHRFSATWTGTVAGYGNYYDNFISPTAVPDPMDAMRTVTQYRNSSDAPVLTLGAELELRREWRQGWMFAVNYSYQRARYLETGDQDLLREVPNTPEHLASIRGAMPIVGRQLMLSSRLSFEGPRWDRNEINPAPGSMDALEPQRRTDPAAIWDVVLSGQEQRAGLRYSLGLYNALDWRSTVPAGSLFPSVRTVAQNGRTLLASVGVNF